MMSTAERLTVNEERQILMASGLWDNAEDLEFAMSHNYCFNIFADEGNGIDDAIGRFWCKDMATEERIPEKWRKFIDYSAVGRDAREKDKEKKRGAMVDVVVNNEWRRYYVIRWQLR